MMEMSTEELLERIFQEDFEKLKEAQQCVLELTLDVFECTPHLELLNHNSDNSCF